jgi:hypothetical protein
MRRLYCTLAFALLMSLLLPFRDVMATSSDAPLYTHFVYMFGHANVFHWLINAWSLVVLHNLLRPSRCITAYFLAVLISFLPGTQSLIGSSVFVTFLMGFLTPVLWVKHRLSAWLIIGIIFVGFLIPGVAALPHLLMFLSGVAYLFCKYLVDSFLAFCNTR